MSYTVLARKWRPRTFAELSGQEHVLRALINALDNDRLHHGFLFTGTRGVGKTTIARILAKCLNCESGVTSTPCSECSTCQEIDEGRFVDLIEVDAASRTKVDDTRELLDNVQYAPSAGRYKVYLIDEVHMLSRHSFNALLKTLEEPPPHVKFLLATTDPQRLPATVLSRCLQFSLKRLSLDIITQRLQAICEAESFTFEQEALSLLAHGADGSMRDALSLLDQAVAFGGGKVEEADVRSMLGTVSRGSVYDLAHAVVKQDATAVLEQIAQMDEYAPNYAQVLQEFALLLQRAAIMSLTKAVPRDSAEMAEIVKTLCASMSAEQIQLYYQIAIIGRRDLALAPDSRSGFEMVMIRMLAFSPTPTPAVLSNPGSGAAQGESRSSKVSAKKKPKKLDAEKTIVTSQERAESLTHPSSVTGESDQSRLAQTNELNQPAFIEKVLRRTSDADPSALPQGLDFSNWSTVIDVMGLQGAARQLASNCVVVNATAACLDLRLASDNQHLMTQQVLQKLVAVMQNHLGDDFKVSVELGEVEAQTPAQLKQQMEQQEYQSIRESLINDPNVRALQEAFDATLNEDSIKLIN